MKLGERGWGWVPQEPSRALYNGLASGFKQELLPHLLALLPEPLGDDVISPSLLSYRCGPSLSLLSGPEQKTPVQKCTPPSS